jgi:hypothetical protein
MRQPSLYLTYIDDVLVEFDAYYDTHHRPVSVRNSRFPNTHSDAGETFGDDSIDEHVRRRAEEEHVRYRGTGRAA